MKISDCVISHIRGKSIRKYVRSKGVITAGEGTAYKELAIDLKGLHLKKFFHSTTHFYKL